MIEQPVKSITKVEHVEPESKLPYTIDSVYVKDDLLYIMLTYMAQKPCEFNLHWNGMWLKTFPPKTTMVLFPVNLVEGKKTFKQTCVFDLKDLNASQPFYLQIRGYAKSLFLGNKEF